MSRRARLQTTLRYMLPAILIVAAGGCAAGEADAKKDEIRPGDMVKVTIGPAHVKVGKETLTTVQAGKELKALKLEGDWVKVAVEKDGEKVTGWIHKRHMKLVRAEGPPDSKGESKPTEKGPPKSKEIYYTVAGTEITVHNTPWGDRSDNVDNLPPGVESADRTIYVQTDKGFEPKITFTYKPGFGFSAVKVDGKEIPKRDH